MCRGCILDVMLERDEEEGIQYVDDEHWASIKWPELTPTMLRCAVLILDLYEFEGCVVGGPLHIVVDDFNIEDSNLDFCEERLPFPIIPEYDDPAITRISSEIISLMRGMDARERTTVLALAHGYI